MIDKLHLIELLTEAGFNPVFCPEEKGEHPDLIKVDDSQIWLGDPLEIRIAQRFVLPDEDMRTASKVLMLVLNAYPWIAGKLRAENRNLKLRSPTSYGGRS